MTEELKQQIEQEAKLRGENHMFIPMDGDYSSYEFHGFIVERSYIAGATAYATRAITAEQENERLRKALKEIKNLATIGNLTDGSVKGAQILRIAKYVLTHNPTTNDTVNR